MTYRLIRKNIIRLVVKKYHEDVEDLLKKFPNSYSKHEFAGELESMANDMKQEHRLSDHINSIRKSLKGVRKEMMNVANQSLVSGKVSKDLFFTNYYGGTVLDNRMFDEEPYDKVIEFEPDNTIAWVFSTSPNDEINNAQIQSEVEHDFGKKCTYVIEKYPTAAEEIPTKDFETNKETKEAEEIPTENDSKDDTSSDTNDDGWIRNPTQIGKVQFDKQDELKLFKERKKWYFTVKIHQEFVDEIWPNSKVAVYGQIKDARTPIGGFKHVTFFAELGEGGKYRAHGKKGEFESWAIMRTEYKAYPLKQKLSSTELGEFQNSDLTGFKVRKLTEDETLLLSGMRTGIPYGENIENKVKVPARFPYVADNPILNKTFYQSKHFLGRMNTGKTVALKWDFLITASSPIIPERERPIFIFIDGQNNFTRFPKIENLNDEAREYCEKHEITNPRLDVLTFGKNADRGDTTLGLDQLPVDSWHYMFAEAAANTEGTLIQELKMARETLLRQDLPVNIENIRREVENRVNCNTKINYSIRNAISRVLFAPETNLFDQENRNVLTTEVLFQPGRSLTLDVHNLNFNDRRAVVTYVSVMLHHHKFVNGRQYPPVIVVLDEAEQIIPARGTEREKYNIQRLSGLLAEITENGRQNYYGFYFVTHLTSKVNPDLVSLAGTCNCFKPSADDARFIKKYFSEIPLDEVLKLNTGEFYMKTFFSSQGQPEILAKCKFPDLSERKT